MLLLFLARTVTVPWEPVWKKCGLQPVPVTFIVALDVRQQIYLERFSSSTSGHLGPKSFLFKLGVIVAVIVMLSNCKSFLLISNEIANKSRLDEYVCAALWEPVSNFVHSNWRTTVVLVLISSYCSDCKFSPVKYLTYDERANQSRFTGFMCALLESRYIIPARSQWIFFLFFLSSKFRAIM